MIDPAVEAEIMKWLQDKEGGQTLDGVLVSVKRPKEVRLHALNELKERGFIFLANGIWKPVPWQE